MGEEAVVVPSPSIGEILGTPTALGIRKELQSLKGNKWIISDS